MQNKLKQIVDGNGTSGRTRTATPVKAMDFESIVSTNFTTLALGIARLSIDPSVLHAKPDVSLRIRRPRIIPVILRQAIWQPQRRQLR